MFWNNEDQIINYIKKKKQKKHLDKTYSFLVSALLLSDSRHNAFKKSIHF